MNTGSQLAHLERHIDSSETISEDGFKSVAGYSETGYRFGQSTANYGQNWKLILVVCALSVFDDCSSDWNPTCSFLLFLNHYYCVINCKSEYQQNLTCDHCAYQSFAVFNMLYIILCDTAG